MELPTAFIAKYQRILGPDFAAFLASLDQPAVSGYRVNPDKAFVALDLGKISGNLGKISGRSVEFLTGAVYSQEPAAQMVGKIAQPRPGMRVLDLCAAPGGKSTHLLSYLQGEGLLVSNEISAKRVKVLVENLERWGSRNALVLNESPARLAANFPAYFDQILVDAPCSGEGMFRKDPGAIQYWSEAYVLECAQRQKEILIEALKMLAPGGELVYSTCTWSPEEDEEIVNWLLSEYPRLELITEKKFWPHQFSGEGQFVAKFCDQSEKQKSFPKSGKSNLTTEQRKLWAEFVEQYLTSGLDNGLLQTFGDILYLLPQDLPDLSKLKIARNGLQLGTFKKSRFEPSYALGMALKPAEARYTAELSREQFYSYAAGNPVQLGKMLVNSWALVLIEGKSFGFAKIVDGTLKNYYPKGLRIHG